VNTEGEKHGSWGVTLAYASGAGTGTIAVVEEERGTRTIGPSEVRKYFRMVGFAIVIDGTASNGVKGIRTVHSGDNQWVPKGVHITETGIRQANRVPDVHDVGEDPK
jgi:hypothetical protein